jgi:peptide/nickel transport system permease protein
LVVALAIPIGMLAGRRANSWFDNLVRVLSYIGVAVPAFVVAIIFLLVFGFMLHIAPSIGRLSPNIVAPPTVTGFITIDSLISGNLAAFFDALVHLILPAIALALGPIAQEARITRSSVVENLNKDYILSTVSHGVPERLLTLKYLLRPSLIPTVSVMGLDISSLIANAFLVELIYNWPGISRYGINAMLRKDLNAIVAVVMIAGIIFAIANIVVDIIVAYLDPRIRYVEKAA